MKTLHKRCAGVDVHKTEVVACLRLITNRKIEHEVCRFPTTTHGLLELADWLEDARCTHVAMESTGVYWKTGVAHSRRAFCADSRECSTCKNGAWTQE
jgi:hypothetical protein